MVSDHLGYTSCGRRNEQAADKGGGTEHDMADLAEALAKRGVSTLTDEELRGNDIKVVKCRSCSGYGACGYKAFYMYDGSPYSVCNLRLQKVQNGEATPEQEGAV